MTAPAELPGRVAAFLGELGTQHPAPWEDAKPSSEDKETDR